MLQASDKVFHSSILGALDRIQTGSQLKAFTANMHQQSNVCPRLGRVRTEAVRLDRGVSPPSHTPPGPPVLLFSVHSRDRDCVGIPVRILARSCPTSRRSRADETHANETKMLWIGGNSAIAKNGLRRKKQLTIRPMWSWMTRRYPKDWRRKKAPFTRVHVEAPTLWIFSSHFPAEGSFE